MNKLMITFVSITSLINADCNNDNVMPVVTCPSVVTLAAGDDCYVNVPDCYDEVSATDNCDTVSFTQSPEPDLSLFTLGDSILTFTSIDSSGNIGTCETIIRVEDQTPPQYTIRSSPSYLTSGYITDEYVRLYFKVDENCCGFTCSMDSVTITRPEVETCESQGENCACRANCGGNPCDASGGGGNLCKHRQVCCCGDSCKAKEESSERRQSRGGRSSSSYSSDEDSSERRRLRGGRSSSSYSSDEESCDDLTDIELYTIIDGSSGTFKNCPDVVYTLHGDCRDDAGNINTFEQELKMFKEIDDSADPNCDNGIENKGFCCLSMCGECGGTGCSLRPGGNAGCCGGGIESSGLHCSEHPAPCIM